MRDDFSLEFSGVTRGYKALLYVNMRLLREEGQIDSKLSKKMWRKA
jgi:hypothetical protein